MEKFIKFLFSCVVGIIVVNISILCIIVPDGDLGAIPITLLFVLSYMIFIACLSVGAYKKCIVLLV